MPVLQIRQIRCPMITSGAMAFFIVGGAILEKSEKSFGLTINRRKCQYYSKRIVNAIQPYATSDAGMLVIVLRYLADQIEQKNQGAKEFAEEMSKILVFPELEEIEKIEKPNRH